MLDKHISYNPSNSWRTLIRSGGITQVVLLLKIFQVPGRSQQGILSGNNYLRFSDQAQFFL